MDDYEKFILETALRENEGNKSLTATRLGISLRSFIINLKNIALSNRFYARGRIHENTRFTHQEGGIFNENTHCRCCSRSRSGVLEAVSKAITEEMASFILFDDEEEIHALLKQRFPSSIGN